MTYALTSLFVLTLSMAGAAAVLGGVERSLRGLRVSLTSYF